MIINEAYEAWLEKNSIVTDLYIAFKAGWEAAIEADRSDGK